MLICNYKSADISTRYTFKTTLCNDTLNEEFAGVIKENRFYFYVISPLDQPCLLVHVLSLQYQPAYHIKFSNNIRIDILLQNIYFHHLTIPFYRLYY